MAHEKSDLRQKLWRELGPVIEKASPLGKLGWMLLGTLGMAALGSVQVPKEQQTISASPPEPAPLPEPTPTPCETCNAPRVAGNVFCHACGWRLGERFVDPFAVRSRASVLPARSSRSGR